VLFLVASSLPTIDTTIEQIGAVTKYTTHNMALVREVTGTTEPIRNKNNDNPSSISQYDNDNAGVMNLAMSITLTMRLL
jgi:hypothetical protein